MNSVYSFRLINTNVIFFSFFAASFCPKNDGFARVWGLQPPNPTPRLVRLWIKWIRLSATRFYNFQSPIHLPQAPKKLRCVMIVRKSCIKTKRHQKHTSVQLNSHCARYNVFIVLYCCVETPMTQCCSSAGCLLVDTAEVPPTSTKTLVVQTVRRPSSWADFVCGNEQSTLEVRHPRQSW